MQAHGLPQSPVPMHIEKKPTRDNYSFHDVGDETPSRRWKLTRHCALSPRIFGMNVAAVCAVLGAIGFGFCIAGYPVILALCLLQGLVLAGAALVHAVHAVDGEQVVLGPRALEVHCTRGLRSHTVRMHPAWSWIERCSDGRAPMLCSGATRVPIGIHLCESQRQRVVAEIELNLERYRSGLAGQLAPAASCPRSPGKSFT